MADTNFVVKSEGDIQAVVAPTKQVNFVVSGALVGAQGPAGKDGVSPDPNSIQVFQLGRTVFQTAHGLAVGDIVYFNGLVHTKSQADSRPHAEVTGMVTAVPTPDSFRLVSAGYITGLGGFAQGGLYFLSPTTPGKLTITEPTTVGQISRPVFAADSPSSGYLLAYRGILIA